MTIFYDIANRKKFGSSVLRSLGEKMNRDLQVAICTETTTIIIKDRCDRIAMREWICKRSGGSSGNTWASFLVVIIVSITIRFPDWMTSIVLPTNSYSSWNSSFAFPFPALPIPESINDSCSSQFIHLIILEHGWMGSTTDLDYLKHTILQQASEQQKEQHAILVHAAKSNDGKTNDGIQNGGKRLAREINAWIHQIVEHSNCHRHNISLSILGYSLGGLYARYALSEVNFSWKGVKIIPAFFITIATPHLGVQTPHSYFSLPSWVEYSIGRIFGSTVLELFRYDKIDIIQQITTDVKFTRPLQRFRYRIAYANAHATDFYVSCSTAAFLSNTDSMHHPHPLAQNFRFVALSVFTQIKTDPISIPSRPNLSTDELAVLLDKMGWVKIICDVRETLLQIRWPTRKKMTIEDVDNHERTPHPKKKQAYSSLELWGKYGNADPSRIHVPHGHTMLVAHSKNEIIRRITLNGRPIMDDLANKILEQLYILPRSKIID